MMCQSAILQVTCHCERLASLLPPLAPTACSRRPAGPRRGFLGGWVPVLRCPRLSISALQQKQRGTVRSSPSPLFLRMFPDLNAVVWRSGLETACKSRSILAPAACSSRPAGPRKEFLGGWLAALRCPRLSICASPQKQRGTVRSSTSPSVFANIPNLNAVVWRSGPETACKGPIHPCMSASHPFGSQRMAPRERRAHFAGQPVFRLRVVPQDHRLAGL